MTISPRACEKVWWGKKVAGVRVTLSKAKVRHVEEMLELAWAKRAPKRLVKTRGE